MEMELKTWANDIKKNDQYFEYFEQISDRKPQKKLYVKFATAIASVRQIHFSTNAVMTSSMKFWVWTSSLVNVLSWVAVGLQQIGRSYVYDLRHFSFEPSFKLRRCCARDLMDQKFQWQQKGFQFEPLIYNAVT